MGVILQVVMGASMRQYQERIDRQTLLDGLTGLANRKAWEAFRKNRPASEATTVGVIDVDGLKATNDTHGHERGDAILIDIANRLRMAAPRGEVFRIGGDEFLVILPDNGESGDQSEMAAPIEAFGHEWQRKGVPVSASFGLAHCPTEGPDLTQVTALADNRMYHMKSQQVLSSTSRRPVAHP